MVNFIQIAPGSRAGGTNKKNNTERAINHLNPDQNAENESCTTNEWPDYLDQPQCAHRVQDTSL